jgi:hypothetical protein
MSDTASGRPARAVRQRSGSIAASRAQRVTHHGHAVQVPKTRHALQQADDDSSSLDRLDRPREQVGRDGLKVLQDEHVEGLTEDLVRVLVVPGGRRGD